MWLARKLLFRPIWQSVRFQPLFYRLHNWALFGRNYGGGGDVQTSGEIWLWNVYLRERWRNVTGKVVIFDVGANVGDYSEIAAAVIDTAEIYAFEPCGDTFSKLEDRKLDIQGLQTFRLGLSDRAGTMDLYSYDLEGEAASVLASLEKRLPTQHADIRVTSTETVPVTTVDEFCKEAGIGRISLLKLDIEGHELKALKGASDMIGNGSIEMIQFEFGPADLYSRTTFYDFWDLLSSQYQIFRLLPRGLFPISQYEELLEIYLTTNYLAVLKTATV